MPGTPEQWRRVNVTALLDGILLRLFLTSSCLASRPPMDDLTDWRHISLLAHTELGRRGLSEEHVRVFAQVDAAQITRLIEIFRQDVHAAWRGYVQ